MRLAGKPTIERDLRNRNALADKACRLIKTTSYYSSLAVALLGELQRKIWLKPELR